MKSAYELAMERLEQEAPAPKLNAAQKAAIAEIDEKYTAKIAEKEVFLTDLIAKAEAQGDLLELDQLKRQLAREVSRLQESGEAEKERVRQQAD